MSSNPSLWEGFAAGPSVVVAVLWIPSCPFQALTSLPPATPTYPVAAPAPFPSILTLQDGLTPLHTAAIHGHVETVRLLLDRGADTGAKEKVRGVGNCEVTRI